MNRTQILLGAALLLQVLLILVFRSPLSDAATGRESRPLLPVLEGITAARVELRGAAGESVTLRKQDDRWRVEEIDGFPADGDKVQGLIDDLEALKVRRPVVSSGRYHEAFKVQDDDHEARILVWDEGDEPKVDLLLGSSSNYRVTNVRNAGEDPVYEVRGLATFDVRADAAAWIEKALVEVEQADVTRLVLTNVAGRFELEKQEGQWKLLSPAPPEGRTLDQQKIEDLVRSATSIQLAEATGRLDAAAHGFDTPAATVLLGAGTEEMTVQIGATVGDEDSKRYVTRSGLEFTGTVWESSVKSLLDQTLDGLHESTDVPG